MRDSRLGSEPEGAALDDVLVRPLAARVGRQAAAKMAQHWALVTEWQQRTNLTGIRSAELALDVHYNDALAALPLWSDSALLDVGSGAGFPGLVLAIARPEAAVTLLEPRRLRAEFLRAACSTLGLDNVEVVQQRAESVAHRQWPCLTMRAVLAGDAELGRLAHLGTKGARLLAFRQGDGGATKLSGPWHRVACHVYGVAPTGANRRIDEWRLTPSS